MIATDQLIQELASVALKEVVILGEIAFKCKNERLILWPYTMAYLATFSA